MNFIKLACHIAIDFPYISSKCSLHSCQYSNVEFVSSGANFAALSAGRVGIVSICLAYMTKAVPIAVRYAATRRQFGPENKEELPILEYPLHVSI